MVYLIPEVAHRMAEDFSSSLSSCLFAIPLRASSWACRIAQEYASVAAAQLDAHGAAAVRHAGHARVAQRVTSGANNALRVL